MQFTALRQQSRSFISEFLPERKIVRDHDPKLRPVCRRDIIPILSPPLRRRFRPQKLGFHHKTPCLSLIPFLPPEGGSHSLRKYHHRILLVSTISTTPHMSGSVHRRRRYGSCRFFVYSFYSPSKYGQSPSIL